jgi:tetratricopeptide (TPR) repeat protein
MSPAKTKGWRRVWIGICGGLVASLSAITVAQTSTSPLPHRTSPLATAKVALAKGDLAGADRILLTLLSSEPNDQEGLLLLGVLRGRQQRYSEAEVLFRRVLQLDAKSVASHRNLAGALLAQDKVDEAVEQYQIALSLDPRDPQLKVELARVEVGRGNFSAALAALDSMPRAQLSQGATPVKVAALLGLNRHREAEEEIMQVRNSPETAMELAEVFLAANLPADALNSLNAPRSRSTQPARFYYLEGKALHMKGEVLPALHSFRQALARDPKSPSTLLAIAEIYSDLGKHSDSFAMLQRAQSIDHDALPILRNLVVEAMRSGQNRIALSAAKVLKQKSADLEDQYLVGTILLQENEYEAARPIFEEYVGQHPGDATASLGLGMLYLNEKRYAEARTALERALQIKPSLPEAEYNLAQVAMKQDRGQEAIQHLERVVQQQPQHAAAWFDLGTLYLESGNLSQAENALRHCLAADPNRTKAEYNFGLVLNKAGKQQEAQGHMQRYQQLLKAERDSTPGQLKGVTPQ